MVQVANAHEYQGQVLCSKSYKKKGNTNLFFYNIDHNLQSVKVASFTE